MHEELAADLFGLGDHVRYVAFGEEQAIAMHQRKGLTNASEAASDRFEELLVNPTLLTLARQRGELDCGGLRYIVVAYGHFSQLVVPTRAGHVSVALELGVEPGPVAERVQALIARHGLAHPAEPG